MALLTALPFEIRNQIWILVLSTSTKSIQINNSLLWAPKRLRFYAESPDHSLPCDFHEPLNISLTQTCKQIYVETQGLFWKHNTLALGPLPWEFLRTNSEATKDDFKKVVHVRLEIDFMSAKSWETEQTMKLFGEWTKTGSLKTLEVCLTPGLINFLEVDYMRRLPDEDGGLMLYQEYIRTLRSAGGEDGYLAGLDRKMVISPGWEDINADEQMEVLRGKNKDKQERYQQLLDTAKALHDAFGGELWQDGKLCWKNHDQVGQPFVLKVDL